MKIITVANRKGGVGKTSTVQSLGTGLARRRYKVLLIDLDSQCNLTSVCGVNNAPLTCFDMLVKDGKGGREELVPAKDIIVHTPLVDIIPGAKGLSAAETLIYETGKEYRLKEMLAPVANDYDFVIIDTPPALNILTINAAAASDYIIIPSQAEDFSLDGIFDLYNIIGVVKNYLNPSLKVLGILITQFKQNTLIGKGMRENIREVADQLNTHMYSTPIRLAVAMEEAHARKLDIFSYAPRSDIARDYRRMVKDTLNFLKEED